MTEQATQTRILPADTVGLSAAVELLESGQPVALPTETVYGLAADATDGQAIARIYAAKGRPAFNPLIVHVPSVAAADALIVLDDVGKRLSAAFWPGPLTLVAPCRSPSPVADLVRAGLPTLAVRVPAHPVMQAVLKRLGRPLAAPSANASGTISPTTAEHVAASLGGRIPLILDGGPCPLGLESSIVGVGVTGPVLLRAGSIAVEALEEVAGCAIPLAQGPITAPGQLASHYAPVQPVRLNATARHAGDWLIGFGAVAGDDSLSASGDLVEAASRLFACLHRAQASGRAAIAVAPVPEIGLGVAINDRLRRAAAPR
jgi:L-threonylcarbamoyladenylate synthase